LHDIGGLRPNDRVLISAAAGGVGQVAVQIARIEAAAWRESRAGRRNAPLSRATRR
jgi:NADPH:quinone reductase-like Zn-dependent oxidoreductase